MMRAVTDASTSEPLVSLKKSEWDAYRLYVAGLEGKVAAYENSGSSPASKSTEASSISAAEHEDRYLSASRGLDVAPTTAKMRPGHVALYSIGWVFFVLQMIPPAFTGIAMGSVVLFGPGQGDRTIGVLVMLGLVAVYLLVVLIQFRLWAKRRPLGVLLFGLLAPWPFWFSYLAVLF